VQANETGARQVLPVVQLMLEDGRASVGQAIRAAPLLWFEGCNQTKSLEASQGAIQCAGAEADSRQGLDVLEHGVAVFGAVGERDEDEQAGLGEAAELAQRRVWLREFEPKLITRGDIMQGLVCHDQGLASVRWSSRGRLAALPHRRMVQLTEIDRTVTLARQLQDTGGRVVLVNKFDVDAKEVDQFLAAWVDDASYFKRQPGYISTQLHRGIAGSCVFLNVAVWESVDHFRCAFANPEFRAKLGQYPTSAVASPHLFRKVAVPDVCVA